MENNWLLIGLIEKSYIGLRRFEIDKRNHLILILDQINGQKFVFASKKVISTGIKESKH